MNIFISGISGTAMGPLAMMAKEAGFRVFGTDKNEGAVTEELRRREIEIFIGEQDGKFLEEKNKGEGVDWFVYTSALPKNHPELVLAKKLGIRTSKRDELIAFLIKKLGLKMVAVAGTHGKTTTTAATVFLALKLGLPVSWLVGTTLGFEEAGKYTKGSKYLIYEADEYDRNFLYYRPFLSVITSVTYDHPDIYKTEEEYKEAFAQFIRQSERTIAEITPVRGVAVAGEVRRYDCSLAIKAVQEILKDLGRGGEVSEEELIRIVNEFPGVGRRFEKVAEGVYSDYAHHPEEIQATVQIAKEEAKRLKKRGVVVVYEPHQNVRQHEVFKGYRSVFLGVSKLFWVPTYLVREDPKLKIITPEEFVKSLENNEVGEAAELDKKLEEKLKNYLREGYLVVLMTAGPGDGWLREKFKE
ncbi:hypothetical protein IJH66_02000 [Candidatus Saccharibacteria bacterium]|nr:hypothetical protein [Candidatus Saccharibacteria bacterium]